MYATDAYARRVAARLTQAADELPYDITERLRAARMQALERRKKPVAHAVRRPAGGAVALAGADGAAVLGWGGGEGDSGEGASWWRTLISALSVAALLVGLFAVHMNQRQAVAAEIAEVDAALLTDDLPPNAYADPGFLQFIKTSEQQRQ